MTQYEILYTSKNHPAKEISQGVLWESKARAQQELARLKTTWSPFLKGRIVVFDPKRDIESN